MIDGQNLLWFMSATLALNLAPGPDMLYVIARSASEGRSAGIVSALGIAGGCVVHMCLVAFGLSGLLLAIPPAYDAVRYAGAAYLVYLGLRRLLTPGGLVRRGTLQPTTLGAIFRQGVVTNVLNPKVALFFLAFLPQFVTPSGGSVVVQLLILGTLFNLSGTAVNLLVALGASRLSRRFERPGSGSLLQRLTGALFVGLGLRLALIRGR
jgi:threonine/homoserine/homoserine lactone efflux protein